MKKQPTLPKKTNIIELALDTWKVLWIIATMSWLLGQATNAYAQSSDFFADVDPVLASSNLEYEDHKVPWWEGLAPKRNPNNRDRKKRVKSYKVALDFFGSRQKPYVNRLKGRVTSAFTEVRTWFSSYWWSVWTDEREDFISDLTTRNITQRVTNVWLKKWTYRGEFVLTVTLWNGQKIKKTVGSNIWYDWNTPDFGSINSAFRDALNIIHYEFYDPAPLYPLREEDLHHLTDGISWVYNN